MHSCRYCGDDWRGSDAPIAVCDACENSPLCDACGHPRGDHTQVFVRGVPAGCHRAIGDFQTLTHARCGCEAFRPIRGPLSDAGFAQPDPDADEIPKLRLAK